MPDQPSNPISFSEDASSGDTVSFAVHSGAQTSPAGPSPEQTLSMAQWTLQATEGGAVNLPAGLQNIPAGPSFKMRRVLGRGGFGEVWEAVQSSLGRVVAVKKLADMHYAAARDDEDQLKRLENEFRQEALTAAGLDHPNIVPVYDLGFDQQGHPLLAMKLVRGTPWDQMIDREFFTMPAAEFLGKHIPILIDVAQAVAFAHSRGVAHRDLKPSQVMVGSFGEVMLMDWGLAMLFDKNAIAGALESEALRFASTRETASSPCGTPAYMAPEQTERTAVNVGPWTDVFLLGATLFQLLTGQPPYADRSAQSAFERAVKMDFGHPSKVAPGREIPMELIDLAMAAMKREPKERVPSASAFVNGLQDFLSGAGKRREAQQLVAAATEQLARKPLDYARLSKILTDLDRAMGLWPGVPGGAELHVAALEEYARTAITGGDLMLARLQAELLPPGKNRDNLIQDIDLQTARARAVKQQRRLFLVASVVLLVAICVSIAVYSGKLKTERDAAEKARGEAVIAKGEAEESRNVAVTERDRAEKARISAEEARKEEAAAKQDAVEQKDIAIAAKKEEESARQRAEKAQKEEAEARSRAEVAQRDEAAARKAAENAKLLEEDARQRAEGLMDFMLIDLHKGLLEAGRLDLMDKVSREALEYYAREEARPSPRHLLQRVNALNNLAGLLEYDTVMEESLSASKSAVAYADDVLRLEPGNSTAMLGKADALRSIFNYYMMKRRLEEGEPFIRKAEETILQARAIEGDTTRTLHAHAFIKKYDCIAGMMSSDEDRLHKTANEGIDLTKKLIETGGEDPEFVSLLAGFYIGLGDAAISKVDREPEIASKYYALATDVTEKCALKYPIDVNLQNTLTTALGRQGYVFQFMTGDMKSAIEVGRRGLVVSEGLVTRNPSNLTLQRDYGVSLVLLGLALGQEGQHEEAIVYLRKSRDVSEVVAALAVGNPVRLLELSSKYSYVAQEAKGLELMDEAFQNFTKAMDVGQRLYDSGDLKKFAEDPGHSSSVSDIARAGRELANEAYANEDYKTCVAWARKCRDFTVLALQDTNNPRGSRVSHVISLETLAAGLSAQDKFDEAMAALDEADSILPPLLVAEGLPYADEDTVRGAQQAAAWALILRGRVLEGMGRTKEAWEPLERALAMAEELQSSSLKVGAGLMIIESRLRLGEGKKVRPLVAPLEKEIMRDPILRSLVERKTGYKFPQK